MVRTVIIDAKKDVRDRIISLLAGQKDIKVLAYGKDGYDALKLVGSLKPDITILDNNLDYIEGEEIPPLIRARSPSTAVAILTAKISDFQLYRAVSNEVSGFIHKDTDMDTLPWILKCISQGGCFISPSFAGRVMHLLSMMNWNSIDVYLSAHAAAGESACRGVNDKFTFRNDPAGYLSKTELMILTSVGEGFSSRDIARNLGLSEGTVRNYISIVMRKTGLRSRPQMVRYAFQHGLVPLHL